MCYTTLKRLQDEFKCLAPKPKCSYGGCTCGVGKDISMFAARTQLIQFLMELNDAYDNIRSQILLMDLVPSVPEAYFMIVHIEKKNETHI